MKGVVDGLGISLESASKALVMTEQDFGRVKRFIEAKRASEPKPVAAS